MGSMISIELLNELGIEIYEMSDEDRLEAIKMLDKPEFRNLGYPASTILNSVIAILRPEEGEE